MDESGDAHDRQGYRPPTPLIGGPQRRRNAASRILVSVNSALSGISIDRRRRLAATLSLFAVLCATVGIVATTGSTPGVVRVFSAVSLSSAALLALIAWGVAHSLKLDLAEQRLDAAIEAAVAARGATDITCGCGHEHDPTEMHITDAEPAADGCAHDGAGTDCAHSCESCLLAALRPSPKQTRAERLGRRVAQ
jgi:hypothetical protein